MNQNGGLRIESSGFQHTPVNRARNKIRIALSCSIILLSTCILPTALYFILKDAAYQSLALGIQLPTQSLYAQKPSLTRSHSHRRPRRHLRRRIRHHIPPPRLVPDQIKLHLPPHQRHPLVPRLLPIQLHPRPRLHLRTHLVRHLDPPRKSSHRRPPALPPRRPSLHPTPRHKHIDMVRRYVPVHCLQYVKGHAASQAGHLHYHRGRARRRRRSWDRVSAELERALSG